MNSISLEAKGVVPLAAEPAVLRGWRLTFNVPDFFLIEGGTGNVVPSAADEVHGVLYACRDESLAVLDTLEALGVNYQRVKQVVSSYAGLTVSAYLYVGLAERLREGYQPSRRYLNIVVRGAEAMGIDPHYLKFLRGCEVKPEPLERPFPSIMPNRLFRSEDLTGKQTALAGAVFDMSEARPEHAYLCSFLGGKDISLFFLKRMDSSDGKETLDDIRCGRLTYAQKRYLNNYLFEFDREYRLVGSMDYQLDLSRCQRPLAPSVLGPPPPPPASAQSVIERAERINESLGHENLGFLSFSHGFMPRIPPLREMPAAFRAWDEIVRELPSLYRTLALRQAVAHLPLLEADQDSLAEPYLLRAAAILAMLTHAYNYVETQPPALIPEALSKPWATVRRRLGRMDEVLSYIDLIVYNWQFVDASAADPFRAENMQLLIPTVGNQEERYFYLTQTEILAQSAPIIGAVARSQEAVRHGDNAGLAYELLIILRSLETMVRESLPKINPNASSGTYIDAVTWAKTVAPFAVPLKSGVQGPSGTSSPIFNLLDVFFGRVKHESFLGREIKGLRATYPLFWQELLEAVGSVSVHQYVEAAKDPNLDAAFYEALAMYAGSDGFLGRHRSKVYGYLETAFKVGRSVTIGGFSGLFKERTWDQVDQELEYSRTERLEKFPSRCYHGLIKSVGQTHISAAESVKHVVIDIGDQGVHYQAGDRCGILPENSDSLVEQTLNALRADGHEPIQLTEEWLKAVQLRFGFEKATTLDLRSFLRFAKIRPVLPRLAEALHALSQNPVLGEAIRQQTTARWQLSDLLSLLAASGMETKRLWNTAYQDHGYIARIVPPEQFRMYSLSSGVAAGEAPQEIHLTVGLLRYTEEDKDQLSSLDRLGTASHFLATGLQRQSPVSFIIDHPPRFHLPKNPATPIIMIGGGTGFAPFRSFIATRQLDKDSGPSWLMMSLRDREHFSYQDDLIPSLASGKLSLDVVFSREDARPVFVPSSVNHGTFQYAQAQRAHIQDLLMSDRVAHQLWQMLQPPRTGRPGAHLYICGRTRFARAIQEALKATLARFFKGTHEERLLQAQGYLCQIAAEGRLLQEVFTHARSWNTKLKTYDVSEIVDRNSPERGYWMIIDSVVYDLSDFMGLHPGGSGVLQLYAGLDATQGFAKVHAGHREIEAMRDMYEIGVLRPLDFKGASRTIALASSQTSVVAVSALYRKWIGVLFLLVEMENALVLDQSLQSKPTTRGEEAKEQTPYKIQKAIETHQRFLQSYAGELGGRLPIELWDLVAGMSGNKSGWMQDALALLHGREQASYPAAIGVEMNALLARLIAGDTLAHQQQDIFYHALAKVEAMDRGLLREVKAALKQGARIFERYEAEVLGKGGAALIAELRRIPAAIEEYYGQAEIVYTLLGGQQATQPMEKLNTAEVEVVKTIYSDRYWLLEEQADESVAVLRRTPVPLGSLTELIDSNEKIIALLDGRFCRYGIIVDLREAPQRNDEAFENTMQKLRVLLCHTFARVTVLLDTAPGLLQVNRIGRNEGAEIFATLNEFAAIKFAKSGAKDTSSLPAS